MCGQLLYLNSLPDGGSQRHRQRSEASPMPTFLLPRNLFGQARIRIASLTTRLSPATSDPY